LVIGIDIRTYLGHLKDSQDKCSYPAADFEALSQYVQKNLSFPQYIPPILIGYSSGATLVYATLVQAPPNTFAGAISMGFCPDLPLTKPLCKGYGLEWKMNQKGRGFSFLPAKNLEAPWIAFNGTVDQVCNETATSEYVQQVKNGRLVLLPKVGHGFGVSDRWMPQLRASFLELAHDQTQAKKTTTRSDVHINDLPLVELDPKGNTSDLLAVIVTGDGGWAGLDREIGNYLQANGVAVIGLNSLQYFWTRRTPSEAATDLTRILRYYLPAWNRKNVILIGYSLGADVLPFMADRLPTDLSKNVKLITLIGPAKTVEFEFHVTDWLGNVARNNSYNVLPEVEKLKETKMICFYGNSETDSLCPMMNSKLTTIVTLSGGHHLGGSYQKIAERILSESK
jgi:type IV secretory pathway VirJ component